MTGADKIAGAQAQSRRAKGTVAKARLEAYNTRISDSARNGDVQTAEELLRELQDVGLRPTRCTYNSIINAHKVIGDMATAEMWVHHLIQAGDKPSVVTFTTMIAGFAQAGDATNAEKWFELLRQNGCQPTEHTHNALVFAYCQSDNLESAEAYLHSYLDSPDGCAKSIIAFNTIIHACARLGQSDKVIYWFHEVVDRGLIPSHSICDSVMNAFGEKGAMLEIVNFSQWMTNNGASVADLSYRALIKACTHHGGHDKAERLFEQILEQGEVSAAGTFNAMIHTCTQTGDFESAERYFRIMMEKGVEPCVVTYNTIINACAASGDTDRVQLWVQRMLDNGLTPNEITYGTLCKAFARKGEVDRIKSVFRYFEAAGNCLNEYFFASLISACGICDPPDVAAAEEAFVDFVRRGFKPARVRRVLARVVGERRTAQLIARCEGMLQIPTWEKLQQPDWVSHRSGQEQRGWSNHFPKATIATAAQSPYTVVPRSSTTAVPGASGRGQLSSSKLQRAVPVGLVSKENKPGHLGAMHIPVNQDEETIHAFEESPLAQSLRQARFSRQSDSSSLKIRKGTERRPVFGIFTHPEEVDAFRKDVDQVQASNTPFANYSDFRFTDSAECQAIRLQL